MHGYYAGNMMGWGVAGGAFMIFFWVALVIFIVWILKDSNTRTDDIPSALDPVRDNTSNGVDILKQRYAKGEINKEEFQMKKTDLLA